MGKAVGEEEPLARWGQWEGGEPRPPQSWETEHPHPAAEEQLPLEGADWSREPLASLCSLKPLGSLGPHWDQQRLHPHTGNSLAPIPGSRAWAPNPGAAPRDLQPRPH